MVNYFTGTIRHIGTYYILCIVDIREHIAHLGTAQTPRKEYNRDTPRVQTIHAFWKTKEKKNGLFA